MASVITVLNLKGGVGKTHTSWLIAGVCQERAQRVLLIDTDPQANLTRSFVAVEPEVLGTAQLLNPAEEPDILALIRTPAV